MAKYFKDSEIRGLDTMLISMLDNARARAGIPFIITCGFRSVEKNFEVGGVGNSAHLTGQAVDILCENSTQRMFIIAGAMLAGFKRIGIGKKHIHLDIDATKPQNVLFIE